MTLKDLIDCYERLNRQLIRAIHNDHPASTIQALDKQANDVVKSIAKLHLTNTLEINIQFKFFMNRSRELGDQNVSKFDFDVIENLVDRYTNRSSVSPAFLELGGNAEYLAPRFLNNEPVKTTEIIMNSKNRVSLFNTDYGYEQTSAGNAAFHSTQPSSIVGKHLADIVGDDRFQYRAKAYYDRCFAGAHQSYSYFIDVPDLGERLMACQLTPHHDNDGAVRGAFFEIEDVTDTMKLVAEATMDDMAGQA